MTATQKLRAEVFTRAKGICECGCLRKLGESGHMDHFWGRARAPESITTCWALALSCDDSKTQNRPSSAHWLKRFGEHCKRYGYLDDLERARAKYLVQKSKGFV